MHRNRILEDAEVWNISLPAPPIDHLRHVFAPNYVLGLSAPPDWREVIEAIDEQGVCVKPEASMPGDVVMTRGLAVAAAVFRSVSREHAHRRFCERFGITPGCVSRELRIQRAIAELRQGRELAVAAATAGFCDQSHFTRCIRKALGITPLALKRQITVVQD